MPQETRAVPSRSTAARASFAVLLAATAILSDRVGYSVDAVRRYLQPYRCSPKIGRLAIHHHPAYS